MEVRMSKAERDMFQSFLASANKFVEFGAGGSTLLALQGVRHSVFSVDSDSKWLDAVTAKGASKAGTLRTHFVDIGPTGDWGFPLDAGMSRKFAAYYEGSFEHFNPYSVDLFLIDGRFRVQCFINTAMRCRSDAIILFHDYTSRSHYHVVERVARKFLAVEDLAAFVVDPRLDRQAALKILEQVGNDPA